MCCINLQFTLITFLTCFFVSARCGGNFCSLHRYAETHRCGFDYKLEGRRVIEQNNPLITADKLPKI